MAGHIVQCFGKRTIDFGTLAVGGTHEVVLADKVDIAYWRLVTLLVNVHSHSLASGAGTILVGAYGQTISELDPGMEFVDNTQLIGTTIDAATPSPTLLPIEYGEFLGSQPFGAPLLRIFARGSRSAPGALTATLSLDMSLKDR